MTLAPGQTVTCIDAGRRDATRSPFQFGHRYSVTRASVIDGKQFVDLAGVIQSEPAFRPAWAADRFRAVSA